MKIIIVSVVAVSLGVSVAAICHELRVSPFYAGYITGIAAMLPFLAYQSYKLLKR